MSVTDVINHLVFGGWGGPSQLRVLRIRVTDDDGARTAGNKLQFIEEDAVMF